MMMSPNGFTNEHQDDTYEELLELREELLEEIYKFEKVTSKKKPEELTGIFPTPDVKYMMNLQYLARLSNLIAKKFNEDFGLGEEK